MSTDGSGVVGVDLESVAIASRRRLVGEWLSQCVPLASMASKLGVGLVVIEGDVRALRREWRDRRRELVELIGDRSVRALDADEYSLRQMMENARKAGEMGMFMSFYDRVRDIQKLRLQLAGLTGAVGRESFVSGGGGSVGGDVSAGGGVADDGLSSGGFFLYESEYEGGSGEKVSVEVSEGGC